MKKIILLFLLIFLGCQADTKPLLVGDKAPVFTLQDLQGNTISSAEFFKGKEVVLNFWASWCPECRQEMPRFNEFSVRYKDKVEIVGINLRESNARVDSFVKANAIKFKILLDSDGKVARLYGVMGVPTNILISREGLIKKLNLDIREMESQFKGTVQ